MTNPHKLKELQVRRHKLQTKLNRLKNEKNDAINEYNKTSRQLDEVTHKINEMRSGIIVSEHAIIRYLQKKYGLDLDELRREIVPHEVAKGISKLGSVKFTIRDSHRLIVKDNVVVTVTVDGD